MVKWLERPNFISMVRGSNRGLVIGIFLQYFIISPPLVCIIQLCHEMPACECKCVNECDFRFKVVCCWGLFWPGMVWPGMVGWRKRASAPLLSIILVFPLKYPRVSKLIRGCIGSSGNVRVYVWISYRSLVMEYRETCIPGRMATLCKILTVIDVKLF